jgi:twitching motility protein PilT
MRDVSSPVRCDTQCSAAQPSALTLMPLVDSLLTAVVRSDGDALVLHVGEKPYVVAAGGPVELSRQGLGLGAMEGMLAQLLSADALRSLRELGAVEHELDDRLASGGDRFTVVAARGGDDIWIELRRHRRLRSTVPPPPAGVAPVVMAPVLPVPVVTPAAPVAYPLAVDAKPVAPMAVLAKVEVPTAVTVVAPQAVAELVPAPVIPVTMADAMSARARGVVMPPVPMPEFAPLSGVPIEHARASASAPPMAETPAVAVAAPDLPQAPDSHPASAPLPAEVEPGPDAPHVPAAAMHAPAVEVPQATGARYQPGAALGEYEPMFEAYAGLAEPAAVAPRRKPVGPVDVAAAAAPSSPAPVAAVEPRVGSRHDSAGPPAPTHAAPAVDQAPDSARLDSPDVIPAVVLSLNRDSARSSGGAARGSARPGGVERLLRLAAARGASALYLTTQARPAVRVDGDIRVLDGEPALSLGDVEAAVLELAPEGVRDQDIAEWTRDLADVGRVRITTFSDYRGPGALLRMISAKVTSAEQLGLVREIQALAAEPEGLVIVTGPRASGKSTIVSAFVDLINRQRNDYVITLEGQIRLVHESRGSLISQREVRGGASEFVTAARMALRENPDVLVIEDLRSPDVLQAALDAAGSGLLVFVSVTAASATAALERLVDLCPSEQRRNVRAALAAHLRGVVAQVLLRKTGGGRLAARELVLHTDAVAALVSDGPIAQLPRAIDSGRKLGMVPLNDALVAFVQSGAVDVRDAYRKAADKVGLLALLRREGIDTSFVERLA